MSYRCLAASWPMFSSPEIAAALELCLTFYDSSPFDSSINVLQLNYNLIGETISPKAELVITAFFSLCSVCLASAI